MAPNYTVLDEHDDRYRVRRHKDGAEFDVPKKGLGKEMQSKIQGFKEVPTKRVTPVQGPPEQDGTPARVQIPRDESYWDNGRLQSYANGTPEGGVSGSDEQRPPVIVNVQAPPGPSFGSSPWNTGYQAPTVIQPPVPIPQATIDDAKEKFERIKDDPMVDPQTKAYYGKIASSDDPGVTSPPGSVSAPAASPPVSPAVQPSAGEPVTPVTPDPVTTQLGPQTSAAGAQATRAPVVGGVPRPSGYEGELKKSQDAAALALQNEADVKKVRLEAEADFAQQEAHRRQQEADKTQSIWRDRQAAADEMFKNYSSMKVDPNKYWTDKGVGGKISSALALIAGGFAQGLSGMRGGNPALQVIESAIDRDIKAQEFNIQKAGSAMNFYAGQTKDIMSARAYAKADALDVAAAQLTALKSKFTAPELQAQTDVTIADFRTRAVATRQEAAARTVQMQAARQQMAVTAVEAPLRIEGMQQQLDANRLKVARSRAEFEALGRLQGGNATERDLAMLGEDARERLIVMNDGRRFVALTPKDKELAQKKIDAVQGLRFAANEMRKFRKEHPGGKFTPGFISGETSAAKAMYANFVIAWKEAAKLGALTGPDVEIIGKLTGSPDRFFQSDDSFFGSLSSIDKSIDNSEQSALSMHVGADTQVDARSAGGKR